MTSAASSSAWLAYDRGSVVFSPGPEPAGLPEYLVWDERAGRYRCHALHYRALVRHLVKRGVAHEDRARAYPHLEGPPARLPPPYPHQEAALEAWARGKRGVVELPTGAGKTQVGIRAMDRVRRGTLVLVPTLELLTQWCGVVEEALGRAPGAIGGGSFAVEPVTVCTYASAFRHAERFGDRFGLVVFDECHHLAGEGYARIAEALIAPYRLGLSATLERPDGRHAVLERLVGPVAYRAGIAELSGRYLAHYTARVLHAELSPAERETYEAERAAYRDYVARLPFTLGSPRGWQRFVATASRSAAGRRALEAYHAQRRIAFAPADKFALCGELLHRHRGERVLVFTNDTPTAYAVSRRFLLPIITHHTAVAERRHILRRFREGRWPALVTARVLNEGVDVPAAGVAIVLSGTASVREHVQRLGRVLRKQGDKQAVLYELLTRGTGEEFTSQRRRRHHAYR